MALWCLIAVAVVLPLVWLINTRDWGVGLMRLVRARESWARTISPSSPR